MKMPSESQRNDPPGTVEGTRIVADAASVNETLTASAMSRQLLILGRISLWCALWDDRQKRDCRRPWAFEISDSE
ncbi:MAG: hypothetical protein JWM11_4977 [Planctomycetaceae bacterium]|nr:hypothetical protein [Planctomycetaceae bacterium]